MAEADLLQQRLLEAQNSDGGWGYQNGSSWTEPTALAILALTSNLYSGAACTRGLKWLARSQKADGGWAPQPFVRQSTWVTSLAALAISEVASDSCRRGIVWLLAQIQPESSNFGSFANPILGMTFDPRPAGGSPWFPGTAAWINPTAMSVLALSHSLKAAEDPQLEACVSKAQDFILSRRCRDGGWNHGGSRYRSDNAGSYPEMTGIALLALKGADSSKLQFPLEKAISFILAPTSVEALSWLQLGLLVHGRDYIGLETDLSSRTSRDISLRLLAINGKSPTNKLLTA